MGTSLLMGDMFTWRTLVAVPIIVAIMLLVILVCAFLIRIIPRDCPYCGSPDLVRVTRLRDPQLDALVAAERRIGVSDADQGYVCRSCKRVADPAIMIGTEPGSYWYMEGSIVYPPMACRECGEGEVISGGPQEHRTCPACGAVYSWWRDENTGYLFNIARTRDEPATASS